MTPAEQLSGGGRVGAAISNAVVGVMHDYTGRGPTQARTLIGDDIVVVIVHDALTKAERHLVDGGEARSVVDMRASLQRTMRGALTEAVEGLSGRRVSAFMSANHTQPDLGCEVFVLEAENPPSAEG